MNRKFGWILAASLLPGPVFALGLGKLVLESALNEQLEARIELLSPTREELDSLNIGLADSVAFERAGVERQFALSGLKFELREGEEGPDFIRVYSRDAIREPFLNFLVEINWSKGHLVREYTVLLDPPLYDPGMRAPAPIAVSPKAAKATTAGDDTADMDSGVTAESAVASAVAYTGGDYGPTQEKDTLWTIASHMRPSDSVSVQQMMLALYRTNPEAFINNNINGLRRGQILRMPSESELSALTREQAFAEAQSQHSAWDPSHVAQGATPAPQVVPAAPQQPSPPATATPAPVAPPAPTQEKEVELRLVAPDKAGTGAGQSAAGDAGAAASGQNLALANEQLSALTQENIDLKDRVAEAETIIEDLKRLIALKDDEISAFQNKLSGSDAAAEQDSAGSAGEPEVAAAVGEAKVDAASTLEPGQKVEATPTEDMEPKPESTQPEAAQAQPSAVDEVTVPLPAPAKPAAAPEAKPTAAGTGIVGQALKLLMANIMILGAGLGAIVLVIGGLVFVSRRKQAKAVAVDEDVAAEVKFPDFAGSEDETILPGAASEEDAATQFEGGGVKRVPEPRPVATPTPDSTRTPAAAPAPEPQEDPLAEVNVFLAYEHFDQAEEFVREAIKREPGNLDFHSKLLEVFYAAGDRRKYEQAAKVLHDLVGGSGAHWDMVLVMWQEISPNRALFSEPSADEEPSLTTGGVGMLDLTSKEKSASADDGSLDFDLGEMTAQPSAQAAAAANDDASDVLDVTASVGLGSDEEMLSAAAGGDSSDEVLDLTGGQGGEEEISDPAAAQSGDDLLDVTSHADLNNAGLDADPLDMTVSARSAARDDASATPASDGDTGKAMDFDLSLDAGAVPASDDNMLEFEPGLGKDDSGAGGLELDLSAGIGYSTDADAGLDLDMGLGTDTPADDDAGLGLDIGAGKDDDLGLSFDMSSPEGAGAGEMSLDMPGAEEGGLDLSFDAADAGGAPDLGLSLDMDAEGSDQTLFVPRTDASGSQSAEDEVATKLDLAKAYVELGDKESARGILEEIAADGNEEQRRQAQELLQQVT